MGIPDIAHVDFSQEKKSSPISQVEMEYLDPPTTLN